MYKKWRIKRVVLWPAVKTGGMVSGVLGFFLGIILGCLLAFFSSIIRFMFPVESVRFGLAALVFFPFVLALIYGILGMIFSFLCALLYNLTAGMLGGLHFEIEDDKKYDYNDLYGEL